MPRYEWTGGPNILGALDPGVQVSGGSNYTPTPVLDTSYVCEGADKGTTGYVQKKSTDATLGYSI